MVTKAGTDEVPGYDEVRTDFCYRSKRLTTLLFGLGAIEMVDVAVLTPGGRQLRFSQRPANKTHTLKIEETHTHNSLGTIHLTSWDLAVLLSRRRMPPSS